MKNVTSVQNQSSECSLVAAHCLSMETFSDDVWSALLLTSNSKLYGIWRKHCIKHTCTGHFYASLTVCNGKEILYIEQYAWY
jgi:hypothetical protein